MPSPFPGMDPYVENPRIWPNVHHRLITACGDQLGSQLRPKYYVGIEERAYITDSDDPGADVIVPDLQIVEPHRTWSAAGSDEGGAELEVAELTMTTTLIDLEVREPRLEILDAQSRAVITVIEILSPSNKMKGAYSREVYAEKRTELLNSKTHLVEIDLLRVGNSFLPIGKRRGDYCVHVSRAEMRPKGELWGIRLRHRLPTISIPLKAGDDDAQLNLQEVFTSVYDRAGFDLILNYREAPDPPLDDRQAAWVDQWLKKKGLR